MKGFTHFVSGICVASFFPEAVDMAASEQSFILCLGGIFGIMPDTLDFKFARYFHKSDFTVTPDHRAPDANKIAQGVAQAIQHAIQHGRSTVQLHTIQLGSNLWRSYSLKFDTATSEVCVDVGPLVDTGQTPFVGTEPTANRSARVKVPAQFFQEFDKTSNIAIMSGPSFEFIRRQDGRIEIVFLPWHRTWSHSATLGLMISLLVGVVSFLTIAPGPHPEAHLFPRWALYPLIVFFGSLVHIIEDSTGFMGNNLFWPFTKDRTTGLGLMSATEAMPNFFFVWTSFIFIFWNLDRFRPDPEHTKAAIGSTPGYFFWFYVVPVLLMYVFFQRGKNAKKRAEALAIEAGTKLPSDKASEFDANTGMEQESDITTV